MLNEAVNLSFSFRTQHRSLAFWFQHFILLRIACFSKRISFLSLVFFLSCFWVIILTLKTMPLFPWALWLTGGMLLLTLPILSGALLMVLADLHSNTLFFDPIFGGFGNYFVPIFQGSPEVVYPRVNNFSILILSLLSQQEFLIRFLVMLLRSSLIFLKFYWYSSSFLPNAFTRI